VSEVARYLDVAQVHYTTSLRQLVFQAAAIICQGVATLVVIVTFSELARMHWTVSPPLQASRSTLHNIRLLHHRRLEQLSGYRSRAVTGSEFFIVGKREFLTSVLLL